MGHFWFVLFEGYVGMYVYLVALMFSQFVSQPYAVLGHEL